MKSLPGNNLHSDEMLDNIEIKKKYLKITKGKGSHANM